ncbi:BON domain-containing protein [Dongia deserti]|uniref:BON domain-containing protein n=1 Tax=Dongia deserti TaxID=2268030 RepID=UPI002548B3ED|nr:BON domain-containing protein [Dongia deserti]
MARNDDSPPVLGRRRDDPYDDGWYRRWISSIADDVASNIEGADEREARMRLLHDSFNQMRRRLMPRSFGYRGRGPRGYVRSDERIRENVNEQLTADPYVDATDIEVLVAEGIVTLNGTVENRAEKRLAEDCVDTVSGVRDVNNNLQIRDLAERAPRNTSEPQGVGGRRTAI